MSPIYINNKKIESIYTNNQSIGKVYVGDVLVFQKNNYNSDSFIFTINTTLGNGNSFDLPLRSGYNYNFVVDWGDNTTSDITSWDDINKLHTYTTDGVYTITITGVCEAWYFNFEGDISKITSVDQWGNTGFINMNNAFAGCYSLATLNDTDGTWCINVTDMSNMFANAQKISSINVSNWNVSNVINMSSMFYVVSTNLSTLDVSNWNVSNVTDMFGMFLSCSSLTSLDVSNWDVSNVTTMGDMFVGCDSLTSLDVGSWDVSNVTSMYRMFYNSISLTTINVTNWDVSNVSDMYLMFRHVPLDTASYDALLIGWSNLPSLQSNITFEANLAKYSSGAATTARGILTSAPNNWTINDGGQL